MNADQLRKAFSNLNGRDLRIEFEGAETLLVRNAMLIPAEQDDLLMMPLALVTVVLRVVWQMVSSAANTAHR